MNPHGQPAFEQIPLSRPAAQREKMTPGFALVFSLSTIVLVLVGRLLLPLNEFGIVPVVELALVGVTYYRFGPQSFIPVGVACAFGYWLAGQINGDMSAMTSLEVSAISMAMAFVVNTFVPRRDWDGYFDGFSTQFTRGSLVWIPTYSVGALLLWFALKSEVEWDFRLFLYQLAVLLFLPFIALGVVQCLFGLPRALWRRRYVTVGLPMMLVLVSCFFVLDRSKSGVEDEFIRDLEEQGEIIKNNARLGALDRFSKIGQIRTAVAIGIATQTPMVGFEQLSNELLESHPEMALVGYAGIDPDSGEVISAEFLAPNEPVKQHIRAALIDELNFKVSSQWYEPFKESDDGAAGSCTSPFELAGETVVGGLFRATPELSNGLIYYVVAIGLANDMQRSLVKGIDLREYKVSAPPSFESRMRDARAAIVTLESCHQNWSLSIERRQDITPHEMRSAVEAFVLALLLLIPIAFVVYGDVGRRSAAEWEAHRVNRLYEELSETRRLLTESEKNAAIGSMVSLITHELNTPLTASILATQYLELIFAKLKGGGQLTDQEIDEALETSHSARENMQRAGGMMNNLKGVFSEQERNETQRFSVVRAISDMVRALRPLHKYRKQTVSIEGPEDIEIVASPGVLIQVFMNLINNSYTHGFPNNEPGEINISVHQTERDCVIDYCDTGVGIPLDAREAVFTQYFTTAKDRGGTGLGLYVVRSIVRGQLDGTLELMDAEQGVHFNITIPLNGKADGQLGD